MSKQSSLTYDSSHRFTQYQILLLRSRQPGSMDNSVACTLNYPMAVAFVLRALRQRHGASGNDRAIFVSGFNLKMDRQIPYIVEMFENVPCPYISGYNELLL
jgi:hypothetical protein